MGVDIHLTILGRKERDYEKPDTIYRALEFYTKHDDKYRSFDFPYFRNSFFFQELQDRFSNGYWNGLRGNIENPDVISWYDKSYEDLKSPEKYWLWGHTWLRLKDLLEWKKELEERIKNPEKSDFVNEVIAENKELIGVIDFMYDSAKKMLDFDTVLEDRVDFEYDIDNSILLIAFDN